MVNKLNKCFFVIDIYFPRRLRFEDTKFLFLPRLYFIYCIKISQMLFKQFLRGL